MSELSPPPWLWMQQRLGPPPSYPNLKIPGVNSPIPPHCQLGYFAEGWGRYPVDEQGRPLYGDVFGTYVEETEKAKIDPELVKLWGELPPVNYEEEEKKEREMEGGEENEMEMEAEREKEKEGGEEEDGVGCKDGWLVGCMESLGEAGGCADSLASLPSVRSVRSVRSINSSFARWEAGDAAR